MRRLCARVEEGKREKGTGKRDGMMNSELRKKTAERGETCSAKRTHASRKRKASNGKGLKCGIRTAECGMEGSLDTPSARGRTFQLPGNQLRATPAVKLPGGQSHWRSDEMDYSNSPRRAVRTEFVEIRVPRLDARSRGRTRWAARPGSEGLGQAPLDNMRIAKHGVVAAATPAEVVFA